MTDRATAALDASLARLRGEPVAPTDGESTDGGTPSVPALGSFVQEPPVDAADLVELLHVGDGIACGVDDAHTHGTVVDVWRDEPTGVFYVALVDPQRRRHGQRMTWTPGARLIRAELLDPATLTPAADRQRWLRDCWRGLYGVVADGKGPLSADESALLGYARDLEVQSR